MATYDKSNGSKENRVWLAIQHLLNEHGRGGEWYRHVEFNAVAISQICEMSVTTVRKYLDKGVDEGLLAKYVMNTKSHMYMYERYNAE